MDHKKSILNLVRRTYIHFLETLEEMALATVARIVPWLIPIAPAWAIKTSVETHLEVDPVIALLMALAFEGMGIYTSHVAFLCWTWNKSRNKKDGEAPFGLMRWLLSAYLIVGLVLVIVIKVYPPSTIIAPAFFLPLGLVVYSAWAVHIELSGWRNEKERESNIREEKNGLTAQIREAKKELATLAEESQTLAETLKNRRSELADLAAEIASQEQAKNRLEIDLARLEALAPGGQYGGQYDDRWPVDAHQIIGNGGQFGPANLARANQVKQSKVELRRAELAALLAENDRLTNKELAARFKVGVSTIKADKKALNGDLINRTE